MIMHPLKSSHAQSTHLQLSRLHDTRGLPLAVFLLSFFFPHFPPHIFSFSISSIITLHVSCNVLHVSCNKTRSTRQLAHIRVDVYLYIEKFMPQTRKKPWKLMCIFSWQATICISSASSLNLWIWIRVLTTHYSPTVRREHTQKEYLRNIAF